MGKTSVFSPNLILENSRTIFAETSKEILPEADTQHEKLQPNWLKSVKLYTSENKVL